MRFGALIAIKRLFERPAYTGNTVWTGFRAGGTSTPMRGPLFDLFSGTSEQDAIWLECVEGLSAARQRMEQRAKSLPGSYFLYSALSHSILTKIDTGKHLQHAREEQKVGAA
jgi:hypothetical protein